MTKQATSIRLSAEAEQDIVTIRTRMPHLNDTTAIEYALHEIALEILAARPAPAARPARTKAAAKETMK